MFGENILLGQNSYKTDEKNRLWLPARTGREPNEILVLVYDEVLDNYKLFKKEVVTEEIQRLSSLIKDAKNKKEKQTRELEFYKYCKNIIRECKIDSQGRLTTDEISEPNEEILMIGAGDYLILEPKKKKKKKVD